jgi:hypothetical protein
MNRKVAYKKLKYFDKRYFIVLPVYKEEKLIIKTLSYYKTLLK